MTESFKTSVRVVGADQVDEFRALCVLLGRRPHQLAADFVLDGIRRAREDPLVGAAPGGDGRGRPLCQGAA